MNKILEKFNAKNSLLILDKKSKNKIKSVKNIPNVKVTDVNHFSVMMLLNLKKLYLQKHQLKN